jgi:hypothetical protein
MQKPDKINPSLKKMARVQRCGWPNCGAACCIYGAWVDNLHANQIIEQAGLIIPWMKPEHREPQSWFDGQLEDDKFALNGKVTHTTVVEDPDHYGGTACIFLRTNFQCALQDAAAAAGKHHWHFKPFYCILHPLELDQYGNLTIDDLEIMVQEPASCLRVSDEEISLTDLFSEEIDYLLNISPEKDRKNS